MRRWLRAVIAILGASQSVAAADPPPAGRRSSYELMAPETRAMQDDETANPGVLWVLDGAALWSA